jgi:hypothetical protein
MLPFTQSKIFQPKGLFDECIAATIEMEILFAAKQAKRLEWKVLIPLL